MKNIVNQSSSSLLNKIYDLFKNISFIEESHAEKLLSLIKAKYPDFNATDKKISDEEWEVEPEKLIVSREGYNRMQSELNRMVNVEMVTLSKELAKSSDISGDVRENVEFNALMEKQTILKIAINRLDNEIKKAEIINPDNISTEKVNIGTKVHYREADPDTQNEYVILGPWDADYGKRV